MTGITKCDLKRGIVPAYDAFNNNNKNVLFYALFI